MKATRKTYVEYFFPNILRPDTSVREVAERRASTIKVPEGCYGFRYFDQSHLRIKGEELVGERKNYSGIYYIGRARALEDLLAEMPDSLLLQDAKKHGYNSFVETPNGSVFPLSYEDVILRET